MEEQPQKDEWDSVMAMMPQSLHGVPFPLVIKGLYLCDILSFSIDEEKNQLLLEMFREGNIFRCLSWKIISLDKLLCRVKHEFNANNKDLYHSGLVLAESEVEINVIKSEPRTK
jgi:hypothetical protein